MASLSIGIFALDQWFSLNGIIRINSNDCFTWATILCHNSCANLITQNRQKLSAVENQVEGDIYSSCTCSHSGKMCRHLCPSGDDALLASDYTFKMLSFIIVIILNTGKINV